MSHDHHAHHGHSDMATPVNNASAMMNHDDHSNHHSGHDMGSETVQAAAAGDHSTHNMMMHMFFHTGTNETILFKFWQTSEIGGLIASMLIIFLLAFVYEALKFYREHLYRHSFQTVQVDTVSVPVENGGAVKETHKTVQIATTSTGNNAYRPDVTPIFISQNTCGCPSPPNSEEKIETVANNNENAGDVCPNTCHQSSTPKITSSKSVHYKVQMLSWMHIWQTCLHVLQVVLSYFLMLIFMTYNVWLCIAVAAGAGFGYFFFGWKKSLVVDITEHCH